jgi:ABC-type Fe3+/spermidine/putrescine transport system ATPase subunit
LDPSGCGKSTLLNNISGLISPSQGDALFDNEVMNSKSPEQHNIAQVFQFPVVYDAMTVQQNLAFPLKDMGMDKLKIHSKVLEIAKLLELTNSLNKKAKNLSADEKQKVSMARGLVQEDVSAIFFDKQLTVIDSNLKWKLRRKLKQIHHQFNITMLYVTHDQLESAKIEMWNRRMEQKVMGPCSQYGMHVIPFFADKVEQMPEYAETQKRAFTKKMQWLNSGLKDGRDFVAGEFSIADITGMASLMICCFLEGLEVPKDLEHVQRWISAVSARPSFAVFGS